MPEFDSSEQNRSEWNRSMRDQVVARWSRTEPDQERISEACMEAIQTQLEMACTHVILPGPLITEREDEAQRQAEWLDTALQATQELDVSQPILATVALHDAVINESAFEPAGFLDTIVDQITAREGLDGVYIVIAQSDFKHPFSSSLKVLKAYGYLTRAFSAAGYDAVITNFADVFGLICTALGSTALASGPSQSLRRLSMLDFRDEGFGLAIPYFYSHQVAAELSTESDLDMLVARRLLRRIQDGTIYSQALMVELSRPGPPFGSARNLPPWAESQNNLTAAQRHLVSRCAIEQGRLARLALPQRLDAVRDWLETATASMLLIQDRIKPMSIKGTKAPTGDWLTLLDELT